jgi:hypothetical protein
MNVPSPIKNLDSFDIVGVRLDGGIDLVVSAQGPIDGSLSTLKALEQKLQNYITEASQPAFYTKYKRAPGAAIMIYISCAFPIDQSALEVIERMRSEATKIGAGIEIKKQME